MVQSLQNPRKDEYRRTFCRHSYVVAGESLSSACYRLKPELLLDGTTPSTKTIYSFGTKQAVYVDTDCRADFVSLEQPQIALVNLEDQKFYTSVYLSLSSVVKLLRYMTDRFHVYPVKETAV